MGGSKPESKYVLYVSNLSSDTRTKEVRYAVAYRPPRVPEPRSRAVRRSSFGYNLSLRKLVTAVPRCLHWIIPETCISPFI